MTPAGLAAFCGKAPLSLLPDTSDRSSSATPDPSQVPGNVNCPFTFSLGLLEISRSPESSLALAPQDVGMGTRSV